jgi:shikimate kinase
VPERLILVGLRGAGKTTVGRRVSELLDRRFLDLDEALEEAEGRTIARLVTEEGWSGFRARESAMLMKACEDEAEVLAVGGGAVLDPENVRLLKQGGVVVWLQATPKELVRRLQNDPATAHRRPPLTEGPLEMELKVLALDREPLYRAVSHHKLDTTTLTPEEAARQVIEMLQESDHGR